MDSIPIRRIGGTKKEPELFDSFGIRDIDRLLAGQDMVQELHRHDFFYILALQKGSGNHAIDFVSYPVRDHSIFLMRPGQVHQLVLDSGSVGYLMQFRNDFYGLRDKETSRLLRRAASVNCYHFETGEFQRVLAILDNIFREYTHQKEKYQDVITAQLAVFFIELVRRQKASQLDDANLYAHERLETFLEILETDIFSHKEVSHYTAALNLSMYQLNSITKATMGKTCSEVINDYLILEAKRYILGTALQVKEIADHLGYEDVSYFIRFFKKHTGFSPNEFRNNFK